ncbi:ATP synthase subunit g, mitochondrial-like [Plodia interpunctella]|uniref:ATP synthase subunit g, mitochondrial-like n=1 Tax=Plodia interpunctella TaxID=58824 RepID=UPI00236817A8|nr:ATP synthase subunit g, mitochondrial-like [Plodia interpunctella]
MSSGAGRLNFLRTKYAYIHNVAEIYRPTINGYREKTLEALKEKAERAAKSELGKKIKVLKGFYTLEMAPPTGNEMQKLQSDLALVKEFIKTGCYKFITVRQAWLLILVGTEIGLWFYLGETIGKMHLVGYKV